MRRGRRQFPRRQSVERRRPFGARHFVRQEFLYPPPPDLEILLHLKIARAALRASRYDEAAASLKRAEDTASRAPVAHGELDYRIRLVKAKLLFDQGKTPQSAALLDSIPIQECRDLHTLAQYHNLRGLILKRQLRLDVEAKRITPEDSAYERFLHGAEHFRRSITMHLFLNDYHGVQAACFNLGDLYGFAHNNIPESQGESSLDKSLHWLALSETISNKLGVGGESIWALLIMFDTALSNNLPLDTLKKSTNNVFNRFDSFEAVAEDIWTEAQRIGNRVEMAECRQIMYRLAMKQNDVAQARTHALGALDLFTELERTDMIRPLKKMITQLEEKNGKRKKHQL